MTLVQSLIVSNGGILKGKNKGGRPKKIIDPELVRKLASIFCTMNQIGIIVGCSVDTLENRFSDVIKMGRETGRTSLLRKQFEVAMAGNVGMLIWLGKQHLGQTDKVEQENNNRNEIVITIDESKL
jgi:hypothetical protein